VIVRPVAADWLAASRISLTIRLFSRDERSRWTNPAPDDCDQVRKRVIPGRIQWRRGLSPFQARRRPQAHKVLPDRAYRCGCSIYFNILPPGGPVP